MLDWIDRAQSGTRHDMLVFHELPLTGLSMTWTRQTILRGCIEIPGPETEEIGKKAKQYACYIVFGSYEVDRDWPNHYMSVTTIIGPDGRIVDKQWKARNIMASLGGIELMTTTIFNVLDRYVEMYGWDRVIPIARTPIGNIATSTVQLEPEIYRAFALKGAEIVLRTATGRFRMADVQGAALHNGYWSAMVNNAYLPFDPNGIKRFWPDGDWRKPIADSTQVLSTIVDAQGRIVSQANSPEEQVIAATVPIAAQRANMRQPVVHMELYQALHNSYRGKYPPNIYLREQPESVDAAAKLLNSTTRWR
jgi:predicted amidohydrolase